MDPSDSPFELGLSWRMREHEARLLADCLRTSRLTLLYAGAGPSRSALLSRGVVPLLARREMDAGAGGFRESRVVAPFVDRRGSDSHEGEGVVRAERVVYFSEWGRDPIPALSAAVRGAVAGDETDAKADDRLPEVLEAICERRGTRLLIVLDAFEQFWAKNSATAEADRFVHALGQALDRPQLPVNFLLAIDDRWEGRLDTLRRAIPGFDDSTVRLLGFERGDPGPVSPRALAGAAPLEARGVPPPVPNASPLPTLSDAVATVPPAGPDSTAAVLPAPKSRHKRLPKAPVTPQLPIKTDGVYAFIESTLNQTADVSEPWHDVDAPPAAASVPARVPADSRPGASSFDARTSPGAQSRSSSREEPPSPIDEWLDAAIAWCRRLLKHH